MYSIGQNQGNFFKEIITHMGIMRCGHKFRKQFLTCFKGQNQGEKFKGITHVGIMRYNLSFRKYLTSSNAYSKKVCGYIGWATS